MKLFARLKKVDTVKREVWGVLAAEVADTSGEIFDYDLSKPYFEKWNERFEKVTDGQSLGNLRAMHGNVAAGKFIDFQYDDERKEINVGAKVVDDVEWKKVTEGVYTGFSIGGKYIRKWQDGELTRYVANPSEGSLVDSPCIPVALFQMVKDNGVCEFRKFQVTHTGGKPMPKAIIKGSALDRLLTLKKVSADDIHMLLNTLEELEEDQALPKQLKKPVSALVDALESLSVADLKALADGGDGSASTADPDGGAGADGDGAGAAGGDGGGDGMGAKADKNKGLAKVQSSLDQVLGDMKKVLDFNAALAKRVEALEKQPAAPKGSVRVIDKEQDVIKHDKAEKKLDLEKATVGDLIGESLKHPVVIR